MEIKQAEFIKSAVKNDQLPEHDGVEIMFCGRSNVGKSSFINMLTNRKKLAKTSANPGKTQTLNLFLINNDFYFVDVPGYGYASLSGKQLIDFGSMMDSYFLNRENLKAMIQLVDIRHVPTNDDLDMINYAKEHKIRLVVIATKADKVTKNQRPKHLKQIAQKLDIDANNIFVYSAMTGEGLDKIEERLRYIYEG